MKGIIFSESMYNQVINSSKTMTRRLIKPQPTGVRNSVFVKSGLEDSHGRELKPRYLPGETVYLKEPYYVDIQETENTPALVYYKYRYNDVYFLQETGLIKTLPVKWQNPRTMPERYARHFIEIVSVKAERLQDISDDDIRKELGKVLKEYRVNAGWTDRCCKIDGMPDIFYKLKQAFAALWDSINPKNKWDTNPFIWCYEFRLIK